MTPGSWRMVDTIARRMGIPFEEASTIADDCARREWVSHRQHTVQLLEEERQVAAAVRKAIVSKRQQRRLAKDKHGLTSGVSNALRVFASDTHSFRTCGSPMRFSPLRRIADNQKGSLQGGLW